MTGGPIKLGREESRWGLGVVVEPLAAKAHTASSHATAVPRLRSLRGENVQPLPPPGPRRIPRPTHLSSSRNAGSLSRRSGRRGSLVSDAPIPLGDNRAFRARTIDVPLVKGPNYLTLTLSNESGSNQGGWAFAFRCTTSEGQVLLPEPERQSAHAHRPSS